MTHRLFEQACEQSKGLARFDGVQKLLHDHIGASAGITTRYLKDACGAVLAEDVVAPANVPAFANSAIDGYAFAHASLSKFNHQLHVTREIFAGQFPEDPLQPGEAARIFTGAIMPKNADTCLMQENAEFSGTTLKIPVAIKCGANTRLAGEDVKKGDIVVSRGTRLTAAHLGAIATTGTNEIRCRNTLKVAIVSTGDEIIRPGHVLQPGQIFDSNFHLLNGLAKSSDILIDDIGVLPDEKDAVFSTLDRLSKSHDLILSTGGASVGDKDFIIAAIRKLGVLRSWKIAIKPGRPLAIGQVGDAVFLGLPGNPVAAFNTWLLFALPIFAYMQGENWAPPQRYEMPAAFTISGKKTGRREFLRGWIENTDNGPIVRKFERDGSGLISSLTRASGLIELPEDATQVDHGQAVSFIPFSSFGIAS